MDNVVAVEQMSAAFKELGQRRPVSSSLSRPKLITLGGDHSLALPALRALREAYGAPLRVLHFDGEFCVPSSGKRWGVVATRIRRGKSSRKTL